MKVMNQVHVSGERRIATQSTNAHIKYTYEFRTYMIRIIEDISSETKITNNMIIIPKKKFS